MQLDLLTTLANDIRTAHTDCEQALTIARSAESSALEHAKRCGELLLAAKAANGHGGWEAWRNENTGIPSSTASLYQRIAERWNEVKELKITSLKAIDRHFREAKRLKSNPQPRVELPKPLELKPGDRITVADGTSTAVVIAIGAKTEIEWQTGQRAKLSAKQMQEYGYRMAPVLLPPVGTKLEGKDGIVAEVVKHDGAIAVVNSRDGAIVTSSRLTAGEIGRGYQVVEERGDRVEAAEPLIDEEEEELPKIDDAAIAFHLIEGDARATVAALLEDHCFLKTDSKDSTDPPKPYKNWQIATYSPNGGVLAVYFYAPWGAAWAFPTDMSFDYLEHDRAIEWAQGIVDRLEVAAEQAEKPQPQAKKVKVGAGHLRAIAQDQSASAFKLLNGMKDNFPVEVDLLAVTEALEEAIMQVLEEWILGEAD